MEKSQKREIEPYFYKEKHLNYAPYGRVYDAMPLYKRR